MSVCYVSDCEDLVFTSDPELIFTFLRTSAGELVPSISCESAVSVIVTMNR